MDSQWCLKQGRKQGDAQVGELVQLLQVDKSFCRLHGRGIQELERSLEEQERNLTQRLGEMSLVAWMVHFWGTNIGILKYSTNHVI